MTLKCYDIYQLSLFKAYIIFWKLVWIKFKTIILVKILFQLAEFESKNVSRDNVSCFSELGIFSRIP